MTPKPNETQAMTEQSELVKRLIEVKNSMSWPVDGFARDTISAAIEALTNMQTLHNAPEPISLQKVQTSPKATPADKSETLLDTSMADWFDADWKNVPWSNPVLGSDLASLCRRLDVLHRELRHELDRRAGQ